MKMRTGAYFKELCFVHRFVESCVSILQPVSFHSAALCIPVHGIWRFHGLSQGEKSVLTAYTMCQNSSTILIFKATSCITLIVRKNT